ncbi:MAG: hypothetical protein KatS3mg003_2386 [Candidatus Nitrosocaldaceae archaeon]|nr:MAG: hypothetical protein KatS3mg003_1331 [Candidatus Nitrosocaldaceae archaeon]GIU72907.1 MAG: hypothetical protein KatS3mg003_2386 [Candidatus Nitrosocaldaceae archaeon]
MRDIELKEFEWYFRDIIFRYYNEKGTEFEENMLADIMQTHLRYRHVDKSYIEELIRHVIPNLSIIVRADNKIIIDDVLERYQCKDCLYLSYIASREELRCSRCNSTNINKFVFRRRDEVQR